MDTQLSIQQLAASTGLSPHTLRYYERIGLIQNVARDAGGRRRYTAADLDWLRFLMRLRQTGMSITEMLRYAGLRREGSSTQAERCAMMEAQLAHVREEIARLQALAGFLADKVDGYHDALRISMNAANTEIKHAESRRNPLPERPRKTRRS
ncbi:MerR family transcriptional regulator [Uliginosibacterium sp. TH139]|uniref:MerR family transcriptional regulator n=1 Tax=Uliginosibacterium sp. TH139 TaxID=2067453 RepID=UPI000C7C6ACC|nr:MerR family transcriptional regulator [Uliginosibacterium sp. TH139]PLK50291.1 MerR family transcriptional regulator [Uliginosibacterium sp. TH139]